MLQVDLVSHSVGAGLDWERVLSEFWWVMFLK